MYGLGSVLGISQASLLPRGVPILLPRDGWDGRKHPNTYLSWSCEPDGRGQQPKLVRGCVCGRAGEVRDSLRDRCHTSERHWIGQILTERISVSDTAKCWKGI